MRRRLERRKKGLWLDILVLALLGFRSAYATNPGPVIRLSHIAPVPSLPRDLDPVAANDVFSISAVNQIHRSLFRLEKGRPLPDVASDFVVSPDRKVFEIFLKPMQFQDGSHLDCKDVRYSILRAINSKVPGFEKLQSVKEIICKKSEPLKVVIKLRVPNPRLPFNLADFRFAILAEGKGSELGLGPYRLLTKGADSLELERVKTSNSGELSKIIYRKTVLEEALEGFAQGRYHDLLAFQISASDTDRIRTKGWIHEVPSPRIYLFALNSFRIPERSVRQSLEAKLDRQRIVNECYPSNDVTDSVVPRGFLGYSEHVPGLLSNKPVRLPKRFRICIADGVGAEACVKRVLERSFQAIFSQLEVSIESTASCNDKWQKKYIDGFFAYLEAESSLDFFKFFHPGTEFFLGDSKDLSISPRIDEWERATDDQQRHRLAINLSRQIRSFSTVIPIFSPKQHLIFSKRYENFEPSVQASSFIRLEQLRLRR